MTLAQLYDNKQRMLNQVCHIKNEKNRVKLMVWLAQINSKIQREFNKAS